MMAKRMSDGSAKAKSAATQTEHNNGNHETELDPIRRGFEIHRGPPGYTHATLPYVWEQEISGQLMNTWDYGFRMTSPYDPFIGKTNFDMNPGPGNSRADTLQPEASDAYTKQGFMVAWYRYYAQMYRYYSVLACRYKVQINNNSHEPFLVHTMFINDVSPPIQASNNDIMIWQGVNTKLVNPKMVFGGVGSINTDEETGDNFDDDAMGAALNTTGASFAVANPNGSSIAVFAGEYRPGQYEQEIHLDEQVSTWTRTNANPTLREALLVRIKPKDSATAPAIGNSNDYNRALSWHIRVEIEYLIEFKELDSRLRWPVNRNPLGLAINDDPAAVPGI